jgi:glutathione transport system substrate-binding protein
MGYENETVNELNLEAQVTADPDARAAIYAEAQKLILDDAIMVILGYPEKAIGAQATVQNLQVSPVGSVVLREVNVEG